MVLYRCAVRSDLPQIVALLREIMEHHDVTPPAPAELSACVATILDSEHHTFLVAEEQGRLLGMCALLFSMSTWSAAPACEVQDLVVTRDARDRGVGRALIDTASRVAQERGCTRLFLLAEYWNLAAHAFYRRLGLAEDTNLDFERDLRAWLP